MNFVVSLISLIFGLLCITREIKILLKNKTLRIGSLVGITYGVTYGILPFLFLFLHEWFSIEMGTKYYSVDYSNDGLMALLLWELLAILGYVAFCCFYSYKPKKKLIKESGRKLDLVRLQYTAWICLFIGMLSIYLWTRAHGGVVEFILQAPTIRDRLSKIQNPLAFFQHPSKVSLIASLMFAMLIKNKKRTIINGIGFIVSFLFSILYLLAVDGRMAAAMYFVSLILLTGDFFSPGEATAGKFIKLLIAAIIALIFISQMDSLTNYIRTGVWKKISGSSDSFLEEFAFIVVSGQTAVKQFFMSDYPFLIIHDIAGGLFAWLPTSLKPFNIIDIHDYNTILVSSGLFKAQIPADFITTSIYDLSLLGPIIFPAFLGFILKRLDNNYSFSLFSRVTYCCFSMSFFRYVNYGLMMNFVLGLFYVFVAFIIYKLVSQFIKE